MEKNKQNKYIIILLIIILGFIFYWYSFRPYHINKLCIVYAQDWAQKLFPRGDQTDVRYAFWKCQKQHGVTN